MIAVIEKPKRAVIGRTRRGELVAIWRNYDRNVCYLIATNATSDDEGRNVSIKQTSSLTCEIIR